MISIKTNAIKLQKGETIIEVIVATLVFAVGILGNLGLQSASVQSNKASLHQTKAILAANDIAERMRANREAALAGKILRKLRAKIKQKIKKTNGQTNKTY